MTKPDWLKIKYKCTDNRNDVMELLGKLKLHTVCEEASCPNLMECFNRRTATFMILGSICTRNCTFCGVGKGAPQAADADEPDNVARAVKELNLKYAVVTSVTRDDLADGGAGHYASVVGRIRDADPSVVIELLVPDFNGDENALKVVADARPDIIGHNVETVPELYKEVRPMAVYDRSLQLLSRVKEMNGDILTKSGIMVGLGETEGQVLAVMKDLRAAGCDMLTVGQYLQPSKNHHPVVEYIHPDLFEKYKLLAEETGFCGVASGPLVRSSYNADMLYDGRSVGKKAAEEAVKE